jgi:hypothetical protein
MASAMPPEPAFAQAALQAAEKVRFTQGFGKGTSLLVP